ncbi:DUF1616 domain-containing protein [Haloarchaeobius sp. DFWS5]|uniref:DUF1616 domain-containing protein n=1 Tax=Haloarchaeobius sp. DFWS5 TaxID=3446114 RepID=UPI003EBE60BA
MFGVLIAFGIDFLVWTFPLSVWTASVVSIPILLFLPGYFVLRVLFPRTAIRRAGGFQFPSSTDDSIDSVERVVLSYGVSLALLPLIALVTLSTSWGLTAVTALAGGTIIVAICAPLAVLRHKNVPESERYDWSFRGLSTSLSNTFDLSTPISTLVNVVLAIAVVSAIGVTGAVILDTPKQAEFAELAVLTENDQGELVAADYPSSLEPGASVPVVLSVENDGAKSTDYTVVVQIQRVADDGTVVERSEVHRFSQSVDGGDVWREPHELSTSLTDEQLRVTYLLYESEAPSSPTRANADVEVFFWVDSTGESE